MFSVLSRIHVLTSPNNFEIQVQLCMIICIDSCGTARIQGSEGIWLCNLFVFDFQEDLVVSASEWAVPMLST